MNAILLIAALWISYPGDTALWRGNELQVKRNEHGGGHPVFWATYAHHYTVDFVKEVDLKEPCVADVRVDGVCRIRCGRNALPVPGLVSNKYAFAAGKYRVCARVYNSKRPPAILIRGPGGLDTDGSWTADWRLDGAAANPDEPAPPAEADARFSSPETPPSSFALSTRREEAVHVERFKGNHLLADFGKETFGFVRLEAVSKAGRLRVVYGESEPEAREEDPILVDTWEVFDVPKGDFRLPISRGFRYVHVIPEDPEQAVGGIAMDYEWLPLARRGSFRCNDEELNRIWDVSAYTLSLTLREILVEGAKRDRWTWSGDAYQSYLMNYYLTGEPSVARDAIWFLRGGDPVVMHMNAIMDYTFYWFASLRDYWTFTGDRTFLRQVWPRAVTMMDWVIGRLDANGRPHDRPGDWMFVDWAPEPLRNNGGVVSFEQMLFVRALESMVEIGSAVGASRATLDSYRSRAAKLRGEIVPKWWSEEKGALLHLLRDDGTLDPQLTRYPNMFGLAWGYFDEAQRASVLKNVIFNDRVMRIQTPYMRFYELESLLTLGRQADVLKEVKSYWGGMLREGATTFWELYNPDEKGAAKYAMYGRPYGKSLCHAWGASPIYLLGRYYLGVEPTAPGFAEYTVKPSLGGLEWMEGDVPTPRGTVHVRVEGGKATVVGCGGRGTLVWGGRSRPIAPGERVSADER